MPDNEFLRDFLEGVIAISLVLLGDFILFAGKHITVFSLRLTAAFFVILMGFLYFKYKLRR